MTPQDIAVVRRLLAHAKAQGWERQPLDITEDGDHGVTYHNYTWKTPDLRICATTAREYDQIRPADWWVNTYDGDTNVAIEHVDSAQQVADLLAAVGIVPVELTSGYMAGRLAYAGELFQTLTNPGLDGAA